MLQGVAGMLYYVLLLNLHICFLSRQDLKLFRACWLQLDALWQTPRQLL
jgi:hypothetical protein